MAPHRVTDAGSAAQTKYARESGSIFPEDVPFVGRLRFGAETVPAHVEGDRAAAGYPRDDLVPRARVQASGVSEKYRRFSAAALPYREPDAVYV